MLFPLMGRAQDHFKTYYIFLIVLLPVFTSSTLTALPPGYEDHILCHPASACLRPLPRPNGWSGARTDLLECCEPVTGEVSRPRSWGWKLDIGYRAELLRQGWGYARQCTVHEAGQCRQTNKKWMDAIKTVKSLECSVDKLLDLVAVGFL